MLACANASASMPGPLSATRTSNVESSCCTVTSTQPSSVLATTSVALSMRLPISVTISWGLRGSIDSSAVSSVTVSSTLRSAA